MPDRRVLVIARHARAVAFAAEDARRALTDRGRRDATEAGVWLRSQDIELDHVFVSSADRAVSTWEALARGLGSALEPSVEEALYAAEPDAAFGVLRTAPADARCVGFVGHNPTAALLAHLLDDGNPDPVAFRDMSKGFPTAAVAVLEVHVPWTELDAATARVAAFHVGRG